MEKWRNEISMQPPRRCRDHPSFSSTLLDAIYRSIDETDNRGAAKEQRIGGAPDRLSSKKHNTATCFTESRTIPPPVTHAAVTNPRHITTSSSSDASSYSSFSSSDTESAPTPHPARLRPIRTASSIRSNRFHPVGDPVQSISSKVDEKRAEKDRHGSIRSCLRDLKNARSPSSPAARIASFLSSIFAAKSNVSAESEDSRSRSRLSKTPTTKRTVRFCPVSVTVNEDLRSYGGDRLPPVRRSKVDEKEEEDEEDDLFELKNLAVKGRLRDELPVYETTRVGKYGGVTRGLMV